MIRKPLIAVNELGRAIGEDHCRALLTDREANMLRDMREADPEYWTYGRLAEAFEISKKHAWRICNGARRGQIPDRYVRR